jgi:hypothetical protein
MAVQRNNKFGGHNVVEFTCVDQDNSVMHVWKDQVTGMWAEQKILISDVNKQTRFAHAYSQTLIFSPLLFSYPAFVTQIQLTSSDGSGVNDTYQLVSHF